jgi:hypothetical protein
VGSDRVSFVEHEHEHEVVFGVVLYGPTPGSRRATFKLWGISLASLFFGLDLDSHTHYSERDGCAMRAPYIDDSNRWPTALQSRRKWGFLYHPQCDDVPHDATPVHSHTRPDSFRRYIKTCAFYLRCTSASDLRHEPIFCRVNRQCDQLKTQS